MGLISINIFFHFIMHYVISCHVMLKATHFLLSLSYVLFYSFVLRPDGPHRRNASVPSAVCHPLTEFRHWTRTGQRPLTCLRQAGAAIGDFFLFVAAKQILYAGLPGPMTDD